MSAGVITLSFYDKNHDDGIIYNLHKTYFRYIYFFIDNAPNHLKVGTVLTYFLCNFIFSYYRGLSPPTTVYRSNTTKETVSHNRLIEYSRKRR